MPWGLELAGGNHLQRFFRSYKVGLQVGLHFDGHIQTGLSYVGSEEDSWRTKSIPLQPVIIKHWNYTPHGLQAAQYPSDDDSQLQALGQCQISLQKSMHVTLLERWILYQEKSHQVHQSMKRWRGNKISRVGLLNDYRTLYFFSANSRNSIKSVRPITRTKVWTLRFLKVTSIFLLLLDVQGLIGWCPKFEKNRYEILEKRKWNHLVRITENPAGNDSSALLDWLEFCCGSSRQKRHISKINEARKDSLLE